MLLADKDIKKALKNRKIIIKPQPNLDVALTACSLDLRLNHEFEVFEHSRIPFFDPKHINIESLTKKAKLYKQRFFILQPGELALASTLEWIELPDDIAARLEGRSSLGRLGIVVHSTAGLLHPGFKGRIVLELGNHSRIPIALYPKMRICALSFEPLTQPAQTPYAKKKGAKYAGQTGVSGSKIHLDY